MDLSPIGWCLAIAGVLITGIGKTGFGGGVGIVAVPLFVLAMGPVSGVGTLLPLLVAADVLTIYHHWGKWDPTNLKVLLPGAVVGTVIGFVIMKMIDARGLEIAIGVISVSYVVLDVVRKRYAPGWHLKPGHVSGGATGTAAGVVSYLAHAAGPIVAIYLLGQRLTKTAMVGTAGLFFFLLNSLKVAPYAWQDLIDKPAMMKGLYLVPFVPLGTLIGARLHHGMSEQVFRKVVMVIVFLSGVQMIVGMKNVLWVVGR